MRWGFCWLRKVDDTRGIECTHLYTFERSVGGGGKNVVGREASLGFDWKKSERTSGVDRSQACSQRVRRHTGQPLRSDNIERCAPQLRAQWVLSTHYSHSSRDDGGRNGSARAVAARSHYHDPHPIAGVWQPHRQEQMKQNHTMRQRQYSTSTPLPMLATCILCSLRMCSSDGKRSRAGKRYCSRAQTSTA